MTTKNQHPLDGYTIVYEITALPYIIYAEIAEAKSPLEFKGNVYVPEEIKTIPVECRFSLYKPDGSLEELSSNMVPASGMTIKAAVNITPLKMIDKLLNKLLLTE